MTNEHCDCMMCMIEREASDRNGELEDLRLQRDQYKKALLEMQKELTRASQNTGYTDDRMDMDMDPIKLELAIVQTLGDEIIYTVGMTIEGVYHSLDPRSLRPLGKIALELARAFEANNRPPKAQGVGKEIKSEKVVANMRDWELPVVVSAGVKPYPE